MEMFNECEFNQLEAEIIYCNTAAVLFLKNDLVQHFEKCLCFFFFFFCTQLCTDATFSLPRSIVTFANVFIIRVIQYIYTHTNVPVFVLIPKNTFHLMLIFPV